MIGFALLALLVSTPSYAVTAHDYCVQPKHASHYANYQECHDEFIARQKRKRKARAEAIDSMGESLGKNHRQRSTTTRCHTEGFGSGAETVCDTP